MEVALSQVHTATSITKCKCESCDMYFVRNKLVRKDYFFGHCSKCHILVGSVPSKVSIPFLTGLRVNLRDRSHFNPYTVRKFKFYLRDTNKLFTGLFNVDNGFLIDTK